MNIREFMRKLEVEGKLIKVKREVSVYYEAAEIMATLDGKPVYLEKIKESNIPVAGNLLSSRQLVAMALNVEVGGILHKLNWAMNNLKEPPIVDKGACQEVVEGNVDLTKLPILKHMPKDRGRYVTSAVCILRDPQTGIRNSSFHRLLLLDERRFVARIVEGRGTDTILKRSGGEADVAICIGSPIQVMIAAATSLPHGVDELGMANALEPTPLVKCKKIDLEVPAETEIVLEGRITKERAPEGPFLDITETYDMEREQPIIEVKYITHRRNPIYQALIPGKSEHKILMGMPMEPLIYNEVNKVCKCLNVYITPGGASWLHAIIQIKKEGDDDAEKAIEAAFKAHKSLKHCIIVDEDINIYDMEEVEWAIATRVQADEDIYIYRGERGSSLDPSAKYIPGEKPITAKMGIDATIPLGKKDKPFKKEKYKQINVEEYLS